MKPLYYALKEAGIPMDNHESDLYVKKTPQSTEIIVAHGVKRPDHCTFISNTDGQIWYDIPFAYLPWWEGKQR